MKLKEYLDKINLDLDEANAKRGVITVYVDAKGNVVDTTENFDWYKYNKLVVTLERKKKVKV